MITVPLKGGVEVLAQMLQPPYLAFFDSFTTESGWQSVKLSETPLLFVCAVTRSFLTGSSVTRRKLEPAENLELPRRWIATFPGSRWKTVWPGTADERRFIVINKEPGGRLIENDITKRGFQEWPVVIPRIDPADDFTINAHELGVLWTWPLLNERLHLCHILGEVVDPLKDLYFDRPLRPEFKTFIDIMSRHGSLSDWGYPVVPRTTKEPSTKKRSAKKRAAKKRAAKKRAAKKPSAKNS